MKHTIRTFNASGKCMYEATFNTAEAAYKEAQGIIENVKKNFPKGYEMTVVRYNDGVLMTAETVKA